MAKLFSPRNKLVLPRSYVKQPKFLLDVNHPLSRGLIGCWPLGDSTNSINRDVSAFGRDMAVVGTAASASPGSHHGGLAFSTNTRAAYLATAFPLLSYPFSLSIWVNYPSLPSIGDGYQFISITNTAANQAAYIEVVTGASNSQLQIGCIDGGGTQRIMAAAAGVFPSSGTWHHCVGVFVSATTFLYYIDGVAQSLTQTLFGGSPNLTIINQANIGAYIYVGGSYHPSNGFLESARIYNRALSQDEITQLYAEPYAGLYAANANLAPATSISANVNLTGVSSTAAAGTLTVEADASVTLTGVNATAAFNTFGAATETDVNLTGAVATGTGGGFASYTLTISMSGVSSTAHAGAFLSGTTINISKATSSGLVGIFQVDVVPIIFVVGVYTIMRNNPVAASGLMSNDVVACQGDF